MGEDSEPGYLVFLLPGDAKISFYYRQHYRRRSLTAGKIPYELVVKCSGHKSTVSVRTLTHQCNISMKTCDTLNPLLNQLTHRRLW